MFVRGDDYRIFELQERYAGHYLPYIQRKIDEERALIKSNRIVGGAGGDNNDFSAKAVKAFHIRENVDIVAHNKREVESLIARFIAGGVENMPPTTERLPQHHLVASSAPPLSPMSTTPSPPPIGDAVTPPRSGSGPSNATTKRIQASSLSSSAANSMMNQPTYIKPQAHHAAAVIFGHSHANVPSPV